MFELSKVELEFLDAMGVESKEEGFIDKESEETFQEFGKKVEKTPDRYQFPLKAVKSYECGDKVIVFIRKYYYDDKPLSKELWKRTNVTRVLIDGVWHNLVTEKGTGNRCTISEENLRTRELGKVPMNKADANGYYYYLGEFDELSFGVLSDGGFSLYVSDHDALKVGGGRTIECDDEEIRFGDKLDETVEFSYENFVKVLKDYIKMGKWDKDEQNSQIMCNVLIPTMLSQEMDEIKEKIKLKRRSYSSVIEEEEQLAMFERLYNEFMSQAFSKNDESEKSPLCKRFG